MDRPDDAGYSEPFVDLVHAEGAQILDNERGRAGLFVPKLRMLVDISPDRRQRVELCGDGGVHAAGCGEEAVEEGEAKASGKHLLQNPALHGDGNVTVLSRFRQNLFRSPFELLRGEGSTGRNRLKNTDSAQETHRSPRREQDSGYEQS